MVLNATIPSPAAPTVTITQNGPLTCSTGLVTLVANGATTYLWSNGATGSSITVASSGTYSVTGTTAGCTNTDTEVVLGNSSPIVASNFSLSTGTILSCGGTTTLIVSGTNL